MKQEINNKVNYMAFAGITFDTVANTNFKKFELVNKIPQNEIEKIVVKVVTDFTGVSLEDIKSKKRHRILTTARQLLQTFLREYTSYELALIGVKTNRDHSTVLYSMRMIKDLIETDKEIRTLYRGIDYEINRLTNKIN